MDKTVKTIATWGPQYEIDFAFMFTEGFAPNVFYNLFTFTDQPDACCKYNEPCSNGPRIPAVYFRATEDYQPVIHVAVAQDPGQYQTKYENILEVNTPYNVQLRTKLSSNGGTFNITINGYEVLQDLPVSGKAFNNVKWFLSDPCYDSVSNLTQFLVPTLRVVNNVPEKFTYPSQP